MNEERGVGNGLIRITRPQLIGGIVVTVLVTALLTFGFVNVLMSPENGTPEAEIPEILTEADNFQELLNAIHLIQNEYVDGKEIEPEVLIEGAIDGVISGIDDPYSMYFDASALEEFQQETVEGEYSGIGASIMDIEGYVTIMVPFEGSPAAETPYEDADEEDPVGMQSGDRILEVDGVDVVGMSADHVAEMIRGPVGEEVTVKVERPQNETEYEELIFNIERDDVEIPTVESHVIDDDIGVLTISRFTAHTPEQAQEQLADLEQQGVTGVIIDLRNNPGGTLDECVEVADIFVPEGPVVQVVDREEDVEVLEVGGDAYALPLVVLTNEFTASGGEILAGALRDRMDVPIVGKTTFGKGSVQRLYYLDPGIPSGMKLTTERYLTADGYSIEKEGGIEPDYEIEFPDDGMFGELEKDPQLQKALELMREKQ